MKRLVWAVAVVLGVSTGALAQGQPERPPQALSAQAQPVQAQPEAQAPDPQQQAGQPAPAAEAPPPVSTDTKEARAKLESYKADLDQKELALEGRTLTDADLQSLRQQIEPVIADIRKVIEEQRPKLEASKERLNQLGAKPADGQKESADVAMDRAEREAAVAELDETQRLGRAVLVQAEQLNARISDLRRSNFTQALFEQGYSLFSPDLWRSVAQALPRELQAQRIIFSDALEQVRRRASLGILLLLGLSSGGAIALYLGRRSLAPRFVRRDPAIADPSRRSRLMAALGIFLIDAVPAMAGSFLVWKIFDTLDVVPPRLEQVVAALLRGLAFIALARALIDAILAPERPAWRLISVRDASADQIMHYALTLMTVIVAGKVTDAFNEATAAVLPVTVATRAIFASAVALIFAALLYRMAARAAEEEAASSRSHAVEADFGGPLRGLGWFIVAAIIGSVVTGYVALASFIVEQAVWVTIVIALLILAIALMDAAIGSALDRRSRFARALQANTGLRRRSLEQIGILTSGIVRLCLIILAVLLVLASWGLESTGLMSSLQAAFFGFQVGDVTISLSSILIAALFFAVGFTLTRMIQSWLDNTFLPATDLDAGLRNSIRTAAGYVGVITAGVVAFSYLGLSLERLTIVAGALSVGIGFGLQSIVNNFISGLILLWERPIRVGDLVVVGDAEGYVRRINVRSTEIQTGDRATLIVPNSNLISGIVRNRVRNDRVGRVLVLVPVPRIAADPDLVADIMHKAALAHREIMSEPPPRVFFKKVTENAFELELIGFVDDIDSAGRVSSDLYFEIFRGLRQAGIGLPAAPPAQEEEQEDDDTAKPEEDNGLAILKGKSPA